MKPYYSNTKNTEFSRFVRAALSIPFVPLDRLNEAMEILKQLVKTIKIKKAAKFAQQFIDYIKKHWINSEKYPPKTWNFFKADIKGVIIKKRKKFVDMKKRKEKLMDDIEERNIKLIDYMVAIGGLNSKFDKRSKAEGIAFIIISYNIYVIGYN